MMRMRIMMKSLLCVAVVLTLSQVSQAVTVVKVVAEQTLGVNAVYDAGTVTWSGGASGTIYYSDGTVEGFAGNAVVVGQATLAVDESAGTSASAVFSGAGSYGVLLSSTLGDGKTISISGDILAGQYREDEMSENYIVGAGNLVNVVAVFGTGWYGGTVEPLKWAGGEFGELRLDTFLPPLSSFSSYDGQTYGSANAIATIAAPEPATMILLGIGGLMLRRRKRV